MNQAMKVVPNFPPPGRVAVSVAVMGTNSCAALDNGDLYCWGGLGLPQVATPTPKKMPHSGVTSLAANDTFICVTGIPAECIDP
ncbi:MAG: hypothetical protein IPJ65_26260 [Archangiaceae bacterium]|nr:hypothetical protein [Archangiaceae bacterium]